MTSAAMAGQVVLVTGGGSGIGLAIAEAFLAQSATVFLSDLEARDDLTGDRPSLHQLVADSSQPSQIDAAMKAILERSGRLDVLVNNVGISGPTAAIEDIDIGAWEDTVRVNLTGTFVAMKYAIPIMKSQGSGCIINISTTSVRTGLPDRTAYVASKAGLEGITRNAARELGEFNIRCNAVSPGTIDNARGRRLLAGRAANLGIDLDEAERLTLRHSSMRCWINPSEIGDACVFLASSGAKHITGQLLSVCGNAEWEG